MPHAFPSCLFARNANTARPLADTAGWELLIKLAREAGERAMADEFEVAFTNEEKHDVLVKGWLSGMLLQQAGVA